MGSVSHLVFLPEAWHWLINLLILLSHHLRARHMSSSLALSPFPPSVIGLKSVSPTSSPSTPYSLVSHQPHCPFSCPFANFTSISGSLHVLKCHFLREASLTTLFRGNSSTKILSIIANNYTAEVLVRFLNYVTLLHAYISNLFLQWWCIPSMNFFSYWNLKLIKSKSLERTNQCLRLYLPIFLAQHFSRIETGSWPFVTSRNSFFPTPLSALGDVWIINL